MALLGGASIAGSAAFYVVDHYIHGWGPEPPQPPWASAAASEVMFTTVQVDATVTGTSANVAVDNTGDDQSLSLPLIVAFTRP